MTTAAWNIPLTRMFADPNCERFPWSPSHACAWFFRCPLGLPPPWFVLFPYTRAPWSFTMSGYANHFIHTPGYTAFKEAHERLSLTIVSLVSHRVKSSELDSRRESYVFFFLRFCPLVFFGPCVGCGSSTLVVPFCDRRTWLTHR